MRNQTVAKEDFALGITPSAPWRVVEVESLGNYRLKVKFIDNLVGIVDINRLVHSKAAGVFSALQDHGLFSQVFLEHGVVSWPGELDLAPDAMHAEIKKNGEWILA
jgi:hypothetical protein